jgi:transposase-like protein
MAAAKAATEKNAATEKPAASDKRPRMTWTLGEKEQWVADFERSGQTLTEFSRVNDLPAASLTAWVRQLRGPGTGTTDAGGFVEVPLDPPSPAPAAPTSAAAVTIRLADGTQLDVPPGTDPLWVANLVRTLRPCSA